MDKDNGRLAHVVGDLDLEWLVLVTEVDVAVWLPLCATFVYGEAETRREFEIRVIAANDDCVGVIFGHAADFPMAHGRVLQMLAIGSYKGGAPINKLNSRNWLRRGKSLDGRPGCPEDALCEWFAIDVCSETCACRWDNICRDQDFIHSLRCLHTYLCRYFRVELYEMSVCLPRRYLPRQVHV